jgi:hypothetical protein
VQFIPLRPIQKVCSAPCAIQHAINLRDKKREKEERIAKQEARKVIQIRKEAIKTRREWMQDAQKAFNAFVRERDKGKPCICCGKSLVGSGNGIGGDFDCGHYRSVGSAPHLRFDERNAHGQTKQCNRYGAGRAVDYRIGLIQRIGLAEVEALEADNEPRKYSIEELKQIKATYTAMRKELMNGRD